MANILQSSVKNAPMPEHVYDVARHPVSASRRGKHHRRRSPVLSVLLALLLFGGGFLLGKSSAAILPGEILPGGDTPVTTVPMEELTVPMEDITVPREEIRFPGEAPVVTPEPVIPEEPAVPPEAEAKWNLRLVSAAHPLPEDFTPPELTQLRNRQAIDKRAYPALQQMMDDARAAGLQPLICSSYRTRATQERLFQNKIDRLVKQGYSREEAEDRAAESHIKKRGCDTIRSIFRYRFHRRFRDSRHVETFRITAHDHRDRVPGCRKIVFFQFPVNLHALNL